MLRRECPDLHLNFGGEVNWATLKCADVLFMQRPALDHHVQMINMAQDNGKPVWIDYDDDLFAVPYCNKAHTTYHNKTILNNMTTMIAKADLISVSTDVLQAKLQSILKRIAAAPQNERGLRLDPSKVLVVPNAYDTELMSGMTEREMQPHQNKIVAWRGSATHDKDLWQLTPALGSVMQNHLDWTYNFIGEPFWLSIETLQQTVKGIADSTIVLTPTLDPAQFLKMLRLVAPSIMIVPLEDSAFNRSKSNIAWLEATHAGAVTLAPDFEEWRRPGVTLYRSPEEFAEKLEGLIRGDLDLKFLWRQSRDYILEYLTVQKVNKLRSQILRILCP